MNDCKLQSQVKLMQLWSYDEDADEVHPGENVKMKVSGVEEEVNYQIMSQCIRFPTMWHFDMCRLG